MIKAVLAAEEKMYQAIAERFSGAKNCAHATGTATGQARRCLVADLPDLQGLHGQHARARARLRADARMRAEKSRCEEK